jgi:hypothetical protein
MEPKAVEQECLAASRSFANPVTPPDVDFDRLIRLAGTPCEALPANTDWVVANRVGDLFPDSSFDAASGMEAYVGHRLDNFAGKKLGLVFVLFRKAL